MNAPEMKLPRPARFTSRVTMLVEVVADVREGIYTETLEVVARETVISTLNRRVNDQPGVQLVAARVLEISKGES